MSRPRILVIDDDAVFRNLLVSLLRKDFIVFVAPDGVEGFHKASEAPPDLAIIDVQMPKWDGLQTLRALRGDPQLHKLPVIMLTGDASRETVIAAIQSGASDYIIKTAFSREDLCRKIQRALDTVAADTPRPRVEPRGYVEPAPSAPIAIPTPPPIPSAVMAAAMSHAPQAPTRAAAASAAPALAAVAVEVEPEPETALVQPPTSGSIQAVLDAWE